MKLLLEQNLSRRIPSQVTDLFSGTDHVGNLGLDHVSDQEIWDLALRDGYTNHFEGF